MKYLLLKKKTNLHLLFLFILSLYYLIPYFFLGQLIVNPHDILDGEVVYRHIIGKIYRNDFESVNLFLAGEIKWYFLRGIFHPLTLLYAFFKTETAFWLIDIFIKLICYICFFKLSRKLECSPFNSALIACVFASSIFAFLTNGLGLAALVYIIYLIIKNKNLNFKNYLLLALFGSNMDLTYDTFVIPLSFIITLILLSNYQKYNFKLFIKTTTVLVLFILLSNSNLIYAQIFSDPFHRTAWIYETPSLISNFNNLIKNFFRVNDIVGNAYFIHQLPFTFYIFPIILISIFSGNKKSHFLLIIIFLILFIDFLINLEFVNSLRNNSEGLIKTLNWGNIRWKLPVLYGLLFINITKSEIIKKTKYLIYPLIFLSLIAFQVRISIIPIGKYFLSFDNFNVEQKKKLRDSFHSQKYSTLIRDIINFNKDKTELSDKNFKSKYTFKGYYNYEDYKYIKSLIGNSRTISIGLDPLVAVMNNIKVIDGYHTLYPLSYKYKFRKIIEKQLDYYEDKKKYYDFYGSRVYTFVEDSKINKINYTAAKHLGADYVISKYSISNQDLLLICKKCNDSSELFLYKIKM